jgi:hypothetical protein
MIVPGRQAVLRSCGVSPAAPATQAEASGRWSSAAPSGAVRARLGGRSLSTRAGHQTCQVNVLRRRPQRRERLLGHRVGHRQEAEDAAAAVVDQHDRQRRLQLACGGAATTPVTRRLGAAAAAPPAVRRPAPCSRRGAGSAPAPWSLAGQRKGAPQGCCDAFRGRPRSAGTGAAGSCVITTATERANLLRPTACTRAQRAAIALRHWRTSGLSQVGTHCVFGVRACTHTHRGTRAHTC